AAVHLASHPARRFGLTDRGLIRPGLAADLIVVDHRTVTDTATYTDPRTLATGIDDVLVSGTPVLEHATPTTTLPGRALHPTTYPTAAPLRPSRRPPARRGAERRGSRITTHSDDPPCPAAPSAPRPGRQPPPYDLADGHRHGGEPDGAGRGATVVNSGHS